MGEFTGRETLIKAGPGEDASWDKHGFSARRNLLQYLNLQSEALIINHRILEIRKLTDFQIQP
jgi:hypothetical protein